MKSLLAGRIALIVKPVDLRETDRFHLQPMQPGFFQHPVDSFRHRRMMLL
jgi:hypothetical protein